MKADMMTSKRFALAFMMSFAAAPLLAHEFWIDSKKYQVETGENIAAFTKNGQNFKGIDLAYFTKRAARFDRIDASGEKPVQARLGDSPVFDKPVESEGLFTLVYQTTPDRVRYSTWEKFAKFADHKAFENTLERHRARDLPETDFIETYTRYAKGLFAVGSGAGKDTQRGLEIEIVALKNPYTDDVSEGLPVQVLYREKPRINAQVEVFERTPEGETTISTLRTNESGVAIIPVKSGHAYLLDNVVLREPTTPLAIEIGAAWETLWASLTFEVR
jgi:cobalt/nickel transport protein